MEEEKTSNNTSQSNYIKENKPVIAPIIDKRHWYDRSYKWILIIPIVVLLFSVIYLSIFYSHTGDLIYKDVSLTGGTTVTVFDEKIVISDLKENLKHQFPDLEVRGISDLRSGKQQGVIIETKSSADEVKTALEKYLGYSLTNENSSIEFTGSSLSAGFYQQLRLAIIIAFILMAIVVFIIFRAFVPSFAVILAAFADIVMTLAVVDLMGMNLSVAGVIAFLMLIGYSVDTDILLTSRVLKNREGSINSRIWGAFKTGITMTLTAMAAVGAALAVIYGFSDILRQIFTIILIGLIFDIFNTWITNASMIKWYAEGKRI